MRNISLLAGLFALIAVMAIPARPAQADANGSQYVYVNAEVQAEVPTYIWANCYRWQGDLAGDFYIGDLEGINFLHGFPTAMSFPAANKAHMEGVGLYNGLMAAFSVDFDADTAVSWNVKVGGSTVWSSGAVPIGYVWAGFYFLP